MPNSISKSLIKPREMPKVLEVKPLVNTKVFQIEQLTLKFSNGEQRTYERFVQWPHGVIMVVPMLDEETVLLSREYCAGIEQYTLSFPKGRVEAGEAPIEAAKREMQEEIGYGSDDLNLLQSMTHSPSYSSTKMHIYIAQGLYEASLEGDEPEPLEVIPWKLKDIDALMEREDFHEGRAITALLLAQKYLGAF